jgi:DNA repair photolyase
MNIIYEPQGRAREYAPLAANLYTGCGHGCTYCYAPAALRRQVDEFHHNPEPRSYVVKKLEADCAMLHKAGRTSDEVLLCFSCDPYQPIDEKYGLTRQAIKAFINHNIPFTVLTKGGDRSRRDLGLMASYSKCRYGVTISHMDQTISDEWEPLSAPITERVAVLKKAHELGIETWVSIEPVIDPESALSVIRDTHKFVDVFKVGMLNHHPHSRSIRWKDFATRALNLLDSLGSGYYIKNDLYAFVQNSAFPQSKALPVVPSRPTWF